MIVKDSEVDKEVTNVAKLIAINKKYTYIHKLTSEIINAFVDKIVIHECEKRKRMEKEHRKSKYTILMLGLQTSLWTSKWGNETGLYVAYYTSNRLDIGVTGENLCSCRYIYFLTLSGLTHD